MSRTRTEIPLPAVGNEQRVRATIESVLDWSYEQSNDRLANLYGKAKTYGWNASELAWETPVDVEALLQSAGEETTSYVEHLLQPPRRLSAREAVELPLHINAFMLSQFLHGEQGALLASAKLVQIAPSLDAKLFAATQVVDEARHVEVYHRYLTEKLQVSYEVHPCLSELLDTIMRDPRWDVTYLGMQIMVEGLALAAFGMMRLIMPGEPLIQQITERIMRDEARHVAFGVIALERIYTTEIGEAELREREEFVIEATRLLHARLLMSPVFERLQLPSHEWEPWIQQTAYMRAFRQMLFSKIVPNLKRLGLLTPRVRNAFTGLDILRYESEQDSVEDPNVAIPTELLRNLLPLLKDRRRERRQRPTAG